MIWYDLGDYKYIPAFLGQQISRWLKSPHFIVCYKNK